MTPRVFKDYFEMLAYIRHKDIEVKHNAVRVEEVKPKKKKKAAKKKEK